MATAPLGVGFGDQHVDVDYPPQAQAALGDRDHRRALDEQHRDPVSSTSGCVISSPPASVTALLASA